MAVIAQCQRRGKTARQRHKLTEMADPFRIGQPLQPHPLGIGLVAMAQGMARERSGGHGIEEIRPEIGMTQRGAIGGGGWHGRLARFKTKQGACMP